MNFIWVKLCVEKGGSFVFYDPKLTETITRVNTIEIFSLCSFLHFPRSSLTQLL